jgi:hypothetical protein
LVRGPLPNFMDCREADAELDSDRLANSLALFRADRAHLVIGKRGRAVRSSPASAPHTLHVFAVGHCLQMLRVAAQPIMAEVIHLKPFGQSAVSEPPSHLRSVRFALAATVTRFSECAVAFVRACQPRPAFVFTPPVDLFPKALGFVSSFTH